MINPSKTQGEYTTLPTKNHFKTLTAIVTLLSAPLAAKADLDINGATGLILNPTANIVEKGQPVVQASYYDFGTLENDKYYGVFGAVGVSDNLEISGGLNRYRTDFDSWQRNDFAIGAKYKLLSDAEKGLNVAVGAGTNRGMQRNVHAYVAATKALGNRENRAPITGTVGVRWDRFQADDDFRSSKASVFAGLEVPLTRQGEWSVLGEIQSNNYENTDPAYTDRVKFPYSIGVRYRPNNQPFSITAGVQRQGILTAYGETKPKLFVQAAYTFGK
jgi:hypothetical protein